LPDAILHTSPEIAFAVLEQIKSSTSERAIISVAMDGAVLNRTQPPGRYCEATRPNRSFVILEDLKDVSAGKF
jgi:hypothetical protein